MKLLTKEIAAKLPRRAKGPDPLVQAKFFGIWRMDGWRWYVYEYDGKDTCFGLVCSPIVPHGELGSFSLAELESAKTDRLMGVPLIERDLYFPPMKLSEIRKAITEDYYP